MKRRGRPVRAAVSGFFLGLFLGLDLLFLGVVPLDSAVLSVAPVAGLVLGIVLALWAPIGRRPQPAPAGAGSSASSEFAPPPPPPPPAV